MKKSSKTSGKPAKPKAEKVILEKPKDSKVNMKAGAELAQKV